jgi:hypothetical protein
MEKVEKICKLEEIISKWIIRAEDGARKAGDRNTWTYYRNREMILKDVQELIHGILFA